MLRNIFKYLTILILILFVGNLNAAQEYTSRSLSVLNGLSQNNANDIIQDSQGYIWIATNDGLNRYDGLEFKIYNIGDLGLGDNLIVSLCEDGDGNIWVGTADKGLYCYFKERNRFFHYTELLDCPDITSPLVTVAGMYRALNNRLWIVENSTKKYIKLEINNGRIASIKEFGSNNGAGHRSAMSVANSIEYFGKSSKLQYYDHQLDTVAHDETISNVGYISAICSHGDNLVLATNKGVIIYNPRNKSHKIHHNIITRSRNICWNDNKLWYATSAGLYYAQYNEKIQSFKDPVQIDEYQNHVINNIIADHAGGIWVTIARQGVRRYEVNRHPFKSILGFDKNVIQCIYVTPKDEILVGTNNRGLYLLDSLSASTARKQMLGDMTISDIRYSPFDDKYYVATGKYVYQYNNDFSSTPTPIITHASLHKLLIDGSCIWISTYNDGLVRYNIKDGSTLYFSTNDMLPSNVVRSVMRDRKGNLWISTANGLAMIKKSEKNRVQPTITPILQEATHNQHILSTLQLQNGDILYCTLGYGLFSIVQDKNGDYKIKDNFTTKSGLANNSVKSIIEDVSGEVWVSTNRGLSRIEYQDGKATTYDIYDGLNDYEFCEFATAQLSDGTLIFGSCNGINYIDPQQISLDDSKAIPTITDFSLFDKSIFFQSDPTCITSRGDIKLKFDENTFTLTFAALNYSSPERAEFSYMLSGVDKDWSKANSRNNSITYKSLRPGEYTFLLKAANSSNIFSDTVLKQNITIEPPLWATWYAFLLYFILITLAACAIVHNYAERLKRHEAIELSKMERRKIEELLEMRTLFFTNISHELRTPLTLILSPLQQLMHEPQITTNTKWRGYLKTMQHNGNSLLRLINELLSYTKQESGKLKCEKHSGDIDATSRALFNQFSFWAEQKSIALTFYSSNMPLCLNYDPYLMEQILYNLISNAIKHTPEHGEISFTLSDEENSVLIAVSNSGMGMDDDVREHIFEHFFSRSSDSSREMGGSGVGLHLTKSLVELHNGDIWFTSVPNEYTTFFVRLPKPSVHATQQDNDLAPIIDKCDAEQQQLNTSTYSEEVITLPSLLIVDDNIEMLNLLTDIFSASYIITTACDGEQGWQRCLETMPDIIISDVMMPKLNGLELLKRVKSDNRTSHIPIVLLTAKSGDEDIAEGYRTQADGYCCKPFNNDVLIESVNSILRNRRLMATRYNPISDEEVQLEPTISNADRLFLKRLSDYIEANVHNPELVVNSLCGYMGVTSLVLNKKLKSLINMTANALIRSIRLKRAADLLKTGRYTIADVTYDVGFSDLRYFRECFKKEFGILPQEYKEKYSPSQES